MEDNNCYVAAKIKQLRVAKKISQHTMAKSLNLTVPAYNRVENGKTQLCVNVLFAIATTLDISVPQLLGFSTADFNKNTNTLIITDSSNTHLHITINTDELRKQLLLK